MQTCKTKSSIRELHILGHDRYAIMFEGCSTGAMLASMLTMPAENQGTGSSIASSLQILELSGKFAGFCKTLAANASRIWLPCLHHYCIANNSDWKALTRCLPKLVYLKELDIPGVHGRVRSRDFIDALRQNGSLQHVVIHRFQFFSEAESHLIRSYCKRNEAIPMLVAKNGDDDKTDLSLFPMLFQSAKQAPRTAPNAILIGLLAAGDGIGPHWQYRKRPCPDKLVGRFS